MENNIVKQQWQKIERQKTDPMLFTTVVKKEVMTFSQNVLEQTYPRTSKDNYL